MSERIRTMEEEYATLDSLLDHMSYQNETGQCVDMVVWYDTISKMEAIQKELAIWRHMPAESLDAIDRADAMTEELHELLNMCKPIDDDEYDEYQEWQDMTSQLRRGDA